MLWDVLWDVTEPFSTQIPRVAGKKIVDTRIPFLALLLQVFVAPYLSEQLVSTIAIWHQMLKLNIGFAHYLTIYVLEHVGVSAPSKTDVYCIYCTSFHDVWSGKWSSFTNSTAEVRIVSPQDAIVRFCTPYIYEGVLLFWLHMCNKIFGARGISTTDFILWQRFAN